MMNHVRHLPSNGAPFGYLRRRDQEIEDDTSFASSNISLDSAPPMMPPMRQPHHPSWDDSSDVSEELDEPMEGLPFSDSEEDSDGQTPSDRNTAEDPSVASSWSVVSSVPGAAAAAAPDNSSVAASSTVSGFDLISLNGSSQKQCPRCTFLNPSTDALCQICEGALGKPNLKLDNDENLEPPEEQDVLGEIPPQTASRAQQLSQSILAVMESCPLGPTNRHKLILSAPPKEQLTVLASRFLECLDNKCQSQTIKLCYCFTGRSPATIQTIYQDGFGSKVRFGSTPDAAAKAYRRALDCDIPGNYYRNGRERASRFKRRQLYSIQEQEDLPDVPPGTVGWLAAILVGHQTSESLDSSCSEDDAHLVSARSGTTWIYRRHSFAHSLPLVSFPADIVETDVIRRLLNGLTQTFFDSPSLWTNTTTLGDAADSQLQDSTLTLQAKKRELKQQLKVYDQDFARKNGRLPEKAEKEPIRHLYENYYAVKSQITLLEKQERGRQRQPAAAVQSGAPLSEEAE